MEYFVEDLLNMRLLREGLFKIQNGKFDLKEALDFIVAIFRDKADAYEVCVAHSHCPEIGIPFEPMGRSKSQRRGLGYSQQLEHAG